MSISEATLMKHFHHDFPKSLLNKYSVALSTFSHCRILFLLASSNSSITAGFLDLSSLGVLTVISVFLLKIFSSLRNTLQSLFLQLSSIGYVSSTDLEPHHFTLTGTTHLLRTSDVVYVELQDNILLFTSPF